MMKFTATSKLTPGMMLAQSIIGSGQTEKYKSGSILMQDDITFLLENGYVGVYTYNEKSNTILTPSLMKNCLTAVKECDIDAMLSLSKEIAAELTTRQLSLDFKSIRSYDDYLPHHSVCVAVYSVAIGIQLGLPESELVSLALAGLLHDIGNLSLDQSLFIKKERLSHEEYALIKSHPERSYNIIKNDTRIPDLVKEAVLHHHENINGTGYPSKQNQDSISTFARIIHISDVYDAIMSKRPYKIGMSNAEALHYLTGGKMILFDEKIVDTFLRIAVPYPTGIEVRLSNGKSATVVGQTYDKSRPIVFVEEEQNIINLTNNDAYKDITILIELAYEDTVNKDFLNSTTAATKKKKILIVDDAHVSLIYTKHALGSNYDVIICDSGSKAVPIVKLEKPDLILMDYEMPDMNGATVALEIQKLNYGIPIVFLTGNCEKETVYECSRCGAADYILKPANPVYLKTRIEMILNNTNRDVLL